MGRIPWGTQICVLAEPQVKNSGSNHPSSQAHRNERTNVLLLNVVVHPLLTFGDPLFEPLEIPIMNCFRSLLGFVVHGAAILLVFASAAQAQSAQITFELQPATSLDAALANWPASGSRWFWGVSPCRLDLDAIPDLIVSQHNSQGSMALRNTFPETGEVDFVDVTTSVAASHAALPIADHKPHCRDFDNDGKEDIAGFRDEGPNASLFNNWPNQFTRVAPFLSPSSEPNGDSPEYLIQPGFTDLNGDGYLDVLDRLMDRTVYSANPRTSGNQYLFNPAGRTFIRQSLPWVPSDYPQSLLDYIDYVFANSPIGTTYPNFRFYDAVNIAGDAQKDLLVSVYVSYGQLHGTRLYVRQTDGTLVDETAARGLPLGSTATVWIGDVNGDGLTDLILARTPAGGIYLQQPNGSFGKMSHAGISTELATSGVGSYEQNVSMVQFDDGGLDLLIHWPYPGRVTIWRNNNAGGFDSTPSLALTGTFQTEGFAVANFDNDASGLQDIVACTGHFSLTPNCTVYRNTSAVTPPPPPPPSDPVTITTPSPLPVAPCGQAYSQLIEATGGTGHQFSIVSGSLPDGLALVEGAVNGYTGVLTFTFTIRATNSEGQSAEKEFSLDVSCVAGSGWVNDAERDETIAKLKWYEEVREPELWAQIHHWQTKYEQLVSGLKAVLGVE